MTRYPPGTLRAALHRSGRAHSRSELVALTSERHVRTAIERGDVVRLLTDAYVAAELVDSPTARMSAALMWSGAGGVLTGESAAFNWNLIDFPPAQVDITISRQRRLDPPDWVRLHRSSAEIRTATWSNVGEVALPAFSLVQAWSTVNPKRRKSLALGALSSGSLTPALVREAMAAAPRMQGRRELAQLLDAWDAGAQSFLEERALRDVFTGPAFARLTRQERVRGAKQTYAIDMYDRETRTAVELDGDAHHTGTEDRLRDIRRDADLACLGIQTLRFAYRDVMNRPEWCRETLKRVLEIRAGGETTLKLR